jgi:hypothetical protein
MIKLVFGITVSLANCRNSMTIVSPLSVSAHSPTGIGRAETGIERGQGACGAGVLFGGSAGKTDLRPPRKASGQCP